MVRVTAFLALVFWLIPLREMMVQGEVDTRPGFRWLWLVGAMVMLVHVALSFHVVHGWSHTSAVVETARQTNEVVGWNWGGGVWVNYAFTFTWLLDALWWAFRPENHARRPSAIRLSTHIFLAFIWFNATVVFGSFLFRVTGLIVFGLLSVECARRIFARRKR